MITVKLWGGLGNQLFQYAYGYQLAKKCKTQLRLDVSWFDSQNLREPEILKLNIKYNSLVKSCDENKVIKLMNHSFVNRLLRIPSFAKYRIGNTLYLKETRYKYSKKIHSFSASDAYLDGYWQCPFYFDNIKQELLNMYTPTCLSNEVVNMGMQLRNEKSIAVHIRRGDYPKKKLWYSRLLAIGEDYYHNAIEIMEKEIPNAFYYVFSNDSASSQKIVSTIVGERVSVIDIPNATAFDEWYLMSCCQNQIIGNSTFSWWAAYMNYYSEKKVIAPNGYMGNDDILPPDWISIDI